MNEKLRKELIEEAEAILHGFATVYTNNVMAFAEGVLGFLKGLEPVVGVGSFNEFGTGY